MYLQTFAFDYMDVMKFNDEILCWYDDVTKSHRFFHTDLHNIA